LTLDHNAANSLAFTVPLRNDLVNFGSESDAAQIAQQHWSAVFAAYRDTLQIVGRTQLAEAANHILRPTQFENASANLDGAGLYPVDYCQERNAIGEHLVGITAVR
jgi:hypothetical protein